MLSERIPIAMKQCGCMVGQIDNGTISSVLCQGCFGLNRNEDCYSISSSEELSGCYFEMASSDEKLMSCMSVVVSVSWVFKDYHYATRQMASNAFCHVSYFFMHGIYHF